MPRAERGSPITEEMSTGPPSALIAPIPRMRRLMMQSPGHNQGTDLPPLDLAPYSAGKFVDDLGSGHCSRFIEYLLDNEAKYRHVVSYRRLPRSGPVDARDRNDTDLYHCCFRLCLLVGRDQAVQVDEMSGRGLRDLTDLVGHILRVR